MKNGNLLMAGYGLLVTAVIVSVFAGRNVPNASSSSAEQAVGNVGEYRGVALQLQAAEPREPYETYIDEIAETGANTVSLVLAAYQQNARSTKIHLDPKRVPSPEYLVKLIGHARKRGMAVVLMPIVLLDNPGPGEWRGKISPSSPDDPWWEEYERFLLHFARIAEQGKAAVLMVGSELVRTEKHTDAWRRIIAAVRKVYGGKLGYSANWDHYEPVQFWNDLDIVGMTSYYDLTGGQEPTMEVLLESWAREKAKILAWQQKVGRPILFTEVGWPNQETCAEFPWDYTRSPDSPAPQLQAMCFESFFRTFVDEPAIAGFIVWEWRNWPDQPTGPEDTGYTPCGKPAMKVIRKYLAGGASRLATRPAPATSCPVEQAVMAD